MSKNNSDAAYVYDINQLMRVKKRRPISIAAIQMNSIDDVDKNLSNVQHLIDSMDTIPDCLVLPEVFNHRVSSRHQKMHAEVLTGETVQWLQGISMQYKLHIIAGSIVEKAMGTKAYNTCVVIDPKGTIIATYRKINLFNADVDKKSIRESDRFIGGKQPVMITIDGWNIGLSICYDLRFPELYREYYKQGVDIIVVPSSFTYATGEKHWHVLCRARAIENKCYVVAPNQIGIGGGGVNTYGHSLIINPVGDILAEANASDEMVISAVLT